MKESCDFMGRDLLRQVTTLPSFVAIGILIRDIIVFICQVTLEDEVIKVLLYNFMV